MTKKILILWIMMLVLLVIAATFSSKQWKREHNNTWKGWSGYVLNCEIPDFYTGINQDLIVTGTAVGLNGSGDTQLFLLHDAHWVMLSAEYRGYDEYKYMPVGSCIRVGNIDDGAIRDNNFKKIRDRYLTGAIQSYTGTFKKF